MKHFKEILIAFSLAFILFSCSGENKKRGIDFSKFKSEVTLTAEQNKKFDEITTKYQKQAEQNYEAAKAQGGEVDRVALGIKNEALREEQAKEMTTVLDAAQMVKFNQFVDEHARKRPRYNNALLEKIKTEAQLTDEEFAVVNAANDAFEKAFNDAHDVYHGNNDLAKQYWDKFDAQRKEVIKKALSPEHYAAFENVVKDVKFTTRK